MHKKERLQEAGQVSDKAGRRGEEGSSRDLTLNWVGKAREGVTRTTMRGVSSESCGPAGQVRGLQIYILGLVLMEEFSQWAMLRCLTFFFF